MKYSFVIPTYQNKNILENTLIAIDNLITPKNTEFEVVVADDGSTDGTLEMLKTRKQNYDLKSVYIKRDELSSRARARNSALRLVSGEIIIFIDSDILLRPTYLLTLDSIYNYSSKFIGIDNLIVSGFRTLIKDDIKSEWVKSKKIFDDKFLYSLKIEEDFRHTILNDISYNAAVCKAPFIYSISCNLAVPKKIIDSVDGFCQKFLCWGMEDVEWMYRIYQTGAKIIFNTREDVLHQNHTFVDRKTEVKKRDEDTEKNLNIFLGDYPNFLGLSMTEIRKLFSNLYLHYDVVEGNRCGNKVIIEYKHGSQYQDVKRLIENYKDFDNTDICIYDSCYENDLDLEVQFMEKTNARICYYPIKLKDKCENNLDLRSEASEKV